MFGLTPRSLRAAPPPPKQNGPTTTALETLDLASDDVRRLSEELAEVLSKPLGEAHDAAQSDGATPHSSKTKPAFSGAPAEHLGVAANNEKDVSKDSAFQWTARNANEDESEPFKADKRSQVWLKRAQRQHRLAQARKLSLRLLIAFGVGAFLILTMWPPGGA